MCDIVPDIVSDIVPDVASDVVVCLWWWLLYWGAVHWCWHAPILLLCPCGNTMIYNSSKSQYGMATHLAWWLSGRACLLEWRGSGFESQRGVNISDQRLWYFCSGRNRQNINILFFSLDHFFSLPVTHHALHRDLASAPEKGPDIVSDIDYDIGGYHTPISGHPILVPDIDTDIGISCHRYRDTWYCTRYWYQVCGLRYRWPDIG